MRRVIDYEDFKSGYQIRDYHSGRPPKVQIGEGMKFFMGAKFGDLALLGKMVKNGIDVKTACDESGVSRRRARRFLIALNLRPPTQPRKKWHDRPPHKPKNSIIETTCDVCLKPMTKTAQSRQKRHQGKCRKIWTRRYYNERSKCRTKP